MDKLLVTLQMFWNDITNSEKEKGATAVEYGLLVALIAAVIIAVVAILGGQIQEAFQKVVDGLTAGGIAPKAG
ncbi:Flp family type IVb pilin [Sinomonas sp. R1AF57]|uniref:Flp family type IVb pilin n=1 Tax=Sinomonas sp. R1AF57 TaxID=2020377 RepID=UPI000B61729D|nr:Flp family type IVb pilin [Sinomonas sp. R1AF57]ASN52636.1 Flp family type IVb pilin [Sinomonas sp. R1AF57]